MCVRAALPCALCRFANYTPVNFNPELNQFTGGGQIKCVEGLQWGGRCRALCVRVLMTAAQRLA